MSLYSDFAPYYEQVFPVREQVYSFLKQQAGKYGGALLDAGCGPGHYCGMFLADGFSVTGIDLDRIMIDYATASYLKGVFRCMDITDLRFLHSSFQLIYSIGNVMAHLPIEKLEAFVAHVYETLEPGGCWTFQVVNWDYLLTRREYNFSVKTIEDGRLTFHRRYSSISPDVVIFETQLVSETTGEPIFKELTKLYPRTSEDYLRLHHTAGFTLEGVYSNFDKTTFKKGQDSGLVMVYTKR
ncbi:MAG: class I SAM-dependent methyltransferase [Chlorobium sp.]|jgi:SAM-dependent methyltransferase|nr:MAG: class I SAM-dependent methyltransferase [Chlorobium sp.]